MPSSLRLAVLKALATSPEPVVWTVLRDGIPATGADSVQDRAEPGGRDDQQHQEQHTAPARVAGGRLPDPMRPAPERAGRWGGALDGLDTAGGWAAGGLT